MALETAVQPGSIAVLEKSQLVTQLDLPSGSRTTQSLLPAIHGQLVEHGWKPADLGLLAVSQGPGSFTGLRVGITVAKTLAYAIGAEVIGVDTLDVIAGQASSAASDSETQSFWGVLDAQRQQLFCAKYERDAAGGWRLTQPPSVLGIDAWLDGLSEGDVVSGPPLEKLRPRIPPGVIFEDAANFAPRAATVGKIAADAFQQGRRDDLWELVPKYHRLSAAEEKRAARGESS